MKIRSLFFLLFLTGSGIASSPSHIDGLKIILSTATGTERIEVLNSLSLPLRTSVLDVGSFYAQVASKDKSFDV